MLVSHIGWISWCGLESCSFSGYGTSVAAQSLPVQRAIILAQALFHTYVLPRL